MLPRVDGSCQDNLKWTDVAALDGKPCSQIRLDVCKELRALADGKPRQLQCWKKERDEWVVDPDKECCCKVKFKGSFDVTAPVSITIPVGPDKDGKNSGLCIITGDVKVRLDVEGELGQCQKKDKKK